MENSLRSKNLTADTVAQEQPITIGVDCLFCNIDKENYIYENDNIFVLKDINPVCETHYLIIPKKHIKSVAHLELEDKELMGEMMLVAKEIGKDLEGYKLKINVGRKGGQEIDHIHMHLLSGNKLCH